MKSIIQNIPQLESFLNECKQIQQNPEFHGEGDVYTHTMMVLNELEKIKDNLTLNEYFILKHCALFHDLGKIRCTKIEDNKIVANGHARVSYHIAMELLDNLDISFEIKKEILMLILYHGKPVWLHEKTEEEQKYEIIKMSMDCNLKLLYYLVLCDFKGRICSDINDKLDNIEYFKLLAEELNCFNNSFQFNDNISKYNYLIKRTHHYSDISFNDTKSKVYMLSGLPGVGKDYYINHNLNNLPIISLDEIRKELKIKATDNQGLIIQTAKERIKEYLRKGNDFILNSTNLTKMMRNNYISIFNDYNAYINIIYIHKDLKTTLHQNKNRETMIPEDIILKLFRSIEIPLNCEAHNVEYIN